MLNFNFGIVKFISSLNTAAKQLLAVLLTLLLMAITTIGFLFQELRDTEAASKKEHAAEIAAIRQEWAKDEEKDERDKDILRAEISNLKREQYEFVTNLWQEQKKVNAPGIQTDKEAQRLAKINRRHVNSIKKDANELIQVTTKQAQ